MRKLMASVFMVLSFLVIGLTSLYAQQVVASGAGNADGTGGTVTYSVGQVVWATKTGAGGTITEGVQQPCEILFFYGIEEEGITVGYSVYPNPATTFIKLKIEKDNLQHYRYGLTDMKGEEMASGSVTDQVTTIPLEKLAAGNYFLLLLKDESLLTVYKVIKY
jgi:hypothetical protein